MQEEVLERHGFVKASDYYSTKNHTWRCVMSIRTASDNVWEKWYISQFYFFSLYCDNVFFLFNYITNQEKRKNESETI